ncbi:MAG: hypothetical protein ACQETA_08455 [Bacteroidota bacterium]
MKKKLLIIQIIFIAVGIQAIGQPGNTDHVQVYIEGSSSGVIDRDMITEVKFNFWITGQVEYNRSLSYSSHFVYKIRNMTVNYDFKKTVKVKEPRDECPHDIASKHEKSGSVSLSSNQANADMVIDYGVGIQAKALEEARRNLPPGVKIPGLDDVPKGVYRLELLSLLKEIEGKCYSGEDCQENECTEIIELGDVEVGCTIKDDGSMVGQKNWVKSYGAKELFRFHVDDCEEEEESNLEVEDPIDYRLKWYFATPTDQCKYKIMSALANAKDSFEEGAYTRMLCFVNRMLEDNESAFMIYPSSFAEIVTWDQGAKYISNLERDNYDELRNDLKKWCRQYDGDELVQAIETLDRNMHMFFKRMEYDEDNYRLSPGQIYVKEQLVKMAGNDKHYLNCYISERMPWNK